MGKTMLKISALIAFVAGILLLMSGVNGMNTWIRVRDIASEHMDFTPEISLAFRIIIILGALGGLTVLLASYLLWKGLKIPGKLLISIGVGMGLIGLSIHILIALYSGSISMYLSPGMGMTGIILSIVARLIAR